MGDNVLTQAEGGAEIVRSEADARALGSTVIDQSERDAALRGERRRAMFDTRRDAVGTFVEGIVDALSIGLLRETGEAADIRRDVNSGAALAGNVAGFAGGMFTAGPVRAITKAAEGAGKAAAKAALRSGEKSLVSRGIQEAASSAALAGGQAFNHQFMDSILEDKEFSSEAIMDEVGLAGLMGAAGGVILGGVGKMAGRAANVKAQGGLVGNLDEAMKPHREAVRAYDEVVTRHAAEVGALRELHAQGHLPAEALKARVKALDSATRAREALDNINETRALSGKDDVAYKRWQKAAVRHRAAVRDLDNVMAGEVPATARGLGRDVGELNDQLGAFVKRQEVPANLRYADDAARAADEAAYPQSFDESAMKAVDDSAPPDWDTMSREHPLRAAELDADVIAARALDDSPLPNLPLDRPGMGKGYKGKLVGGDTGKLAGGMRPGAGYRATGLVDDVGSAASPSELENLLRMQREAGIAPRRDPNAVTGEIPLVNDPIPRPLQTVGGNVVYSARDLADYHSAYPNMGPGTGPASGPTGAQTPSALRGAADEIPIHQDWETRLTADDPHPRQGFDPQNFERDVTLSGFEPPTKPRPIDAADARIQALMDELAATANGRLDSAAGLGVLDRAGIRSAGDNVGAYMDQVYALRRTAQLAAMPAAKQGLLRGALSAALGGAVAGPAGSVVAMAANAMFLKRGARIAAASGALAGRVAGAAAKMLTPTKVRATAAAVANTPHAYSADGPIEDPIERIQEIQFLAAHPDAIMEQVARSAGDLADQPALLQALQTRAVNKVQRIAIRAPAIYFDKLGRALAPSQGKMREFLEYENAAHNLGALLDAVGAGTVSRVQADALQENWTSVSMKMAAAVFADPERLKRLPRERLRAVEMVTGMSLSGASDPLFVARQNIAWQPVEPQAPPGKPQAFNINPTGAPTPSQSNATGRAPGN